MSDKVDLGQLVSDMTKEAVKSPTNVVQQVHDAIAQGDTVEIHPVADKFPMIDDYEPEAFQAMLEDVRERGVLEPLRIDKQGRIVDGRNRYAIIQSLRSEGIVVEFDVKMIDVADDEVNKWIMSMNIHRRHLSTSQRAMLASDIATATKSSGGMNKDGSQDHVTAKQAAETMNVSERSVKSANKVKREAEKQGKPEVIKQVREGKKAVTTAAEELKPRKKKAAPKPADAPAAKPVAKKGKSTLALSDTEMMTVKELLSRASAAQLSGLIGIIKGNLKVLGEG